MRTLVTSVTSKDVEWSFTRGSGKGGQNRNKRDTAVRVTHPPSGAVGYSETARTQGENRKLAFRRMAESDQFQQWARKEAAADALDSATMRAQVERRVEQMMHPRNLKIETGESF